MDVDFTVCTFMFKINFFSATVKCNIIDIDADNITVEQFRFYKRSSAACELVKD